MEQPNGLKVFNAFAKIKALGAERVQSLCEMWRQTPTAREFGISEMVVTADESEMLLSFSCEITHRVEDGDETGFPMDDLLFYIAEHGVDIEAERKTLKSEIIDARKRGGPDIWRRFMMRPGPRLPLFITCKNPSCRNLMMTQLRHYKCERFEYNPSQVECPRCHSTYEYDHEDYHFGPNA